MQWALDNNSVVFTHDLDFGIILALTRAETPSVIQVRTQDVTPANLAPKVLSVLQNHCEELIRRALITIDEGRSRIRILPIESKQSG